LINVQSQNATTYNLTEIIHSQSSEVLKNTTFHDNNKDKMFSKGDYFILKTDWDGPELDRNSDGNFTNDGPIEIGDEFILTHKISGYMIRMNIKT
jgi:hypothetical protein